MGSSEPSLGTEDSASMVVSESDLASSISLQPSSPEGRPDNFSPVFATAKMIALMETAAARIIVPYQAADELSVGVIVNVKHSAATPPGAKVRASARYKGRDGKLYVFDVWAEDEAGEIGSGEHKRAIVKAERILSGAKRRAPKGDKASL